MNQRLSVYTSIKERRSQGKETWSRSKTLGCACRDLDFVRSLMTKFRPIHSRPLRPPSFPLSCPYFCSRIRVCPHVCVCRHVHTCPAPAFSCTPASPRAPSSVHAIYTMGTGAVHSPAAEGHFWRAAWCGDSFGDARQQYVEPWVWQYILFSQGEKGVSW